MTSPKLLQKLGVLFKRHSSPEKRKNHPWARIQKQNGQTFLSWGMGDGRTFGVLTIHPGDSFSLEEDGFHHRSGTGEHVFGIAGKEKENLLLGAEIEGTLRKKRSFFVLGTGVVVSFVGILLLFATSIGPGLRHLDSLSQSSLNGLEGVNSPSDTFPGMGGLTCKVGH